ncbi:MAG TPA: group 1 truncated hemoglobin [Candidatus Acidoferrales bacterium]|nr:group 1 truncated hemoglobin [Candidatus Acidoferrales bacterium]
MRPSLFVTIGGRETILAAVTAFYRRVLADPELGPFFKNADAANLAARQSMFLTMLLGGGHPDAAGIISSAHAPSRAIGLNDSHFNSFLNHLRDALAEVGVSPESVEEILALLERSRGPVLGS